MVISYNNRAKRDISNCSSYCCDTDKKQIELSNKQHLFNLRIENYLVAKCLVEQYKNQKHLWEKEEQNKILFASNSLFFFMTNNTFLEEIQGIAKGKAFGKAVVATRSKIVPHIGNTPLTVAGTKQRSETTPRQAPKIILF